MSDKKRRDITLGEMQDECKKYWNNGNLGSCGKCQYMEVCCHYEAYAPAQLNLTDTPRFTEAQMAFFKPWLDIGARWASRDSDDPFCHEITFYNELQQIIGYMVHTETANSMPMQQRLDLAELLGKDGAE